MGEVSVFQLGLASVVPEEAGSLSGVEALTAEDVPALELGVLDGVPAQPHKSPAIQTTANTVFHFFSILIFLLTEIV